MKARTLTVGLLPPATKTELAKQLGISRGSLYYQPKQPAIDDEVRRQIEAVWVDQPSYGHKRLALALKLNRKRILRVMHKFHLKPYRRRVNGPPAKLDDIGKPLAPYPNLSSDRCPIAPAVIWVADFTYLKYGARFLYLATVIDRFTREVVGVNCSRYHNAELVLGALEDAVKQTNTIPHIFHSDQGAEYTSMEHTTLCQKIGIQISMSDKASPWQNGYQESFYAQFKLDLGYLDRFETLGALVEAIHLQIYMYNTKRIHTALKMPPSTFHQQFEQTKNTQTGR